MSFLEQITQARRADAKARLGILEDLKQRALDRTPGPNFAFAIADEGLSLIAEFKRSSPSVGAINTDLDPGERARAYQEGGARAMSVLTEPNYFGGSMDDLALARAACSLPILRKDFLCTELHLYEACAGGADAVLLIAAALGSSELEDLHSLARELGLAVLLEVHSEDEVGSALGAGASIIGINTRDLATLEVDPGQVARVRPSIPKGVLVVGESGIKTRSDVEALEQVGVDGILVGEALMRANDVNAAVRTLLGS